MIWGAEVCDDAGYRTDGLVAVGTDSDSDVEIQHVATLAVNVPDHWREASFATAAAAAVLNQCADEVVVFVSAMALCTASTGSAATLPAASATVITMISFAVALAVDVFEASSCAGGQVVAVDTSSAAFDPILAAAAAAAVAAATVVTAAFASRARHAWTAGSPLCSASAKYVPRTAGLVRDGAETGAAATRIAAAAAELASVVVVVVVEGHMNRKFGMPKRR